MEKLKISNFLLRLNIKRFVIFFSNILLLLVIGIVILLIISLIYNERGDFSLIYKILGVTHTKGIKLSFLLLFISFCLKNIEDLILKPSYFDNHLKSNVILIQVIIFLFFIGISYYFFSSFPNLIFTGVDGDYMISLEKTQFKWNKNISDFSSNFLQGLGGNIIFPLNTNIDLGYLTSRIFSNNFNSILAQTIWASIIYLSVLFFSRIIHLPNALGIVSAWLAPILILFPQPFRFYPVAALVPHISTSISLFLIIAGFILWVNANKTREYIAIKVFLLIVCLEYSLISNPSSILVLFPILTVFFFTRISLIKTFKQKIIETVIYLIVFFFLFFTGAIDFLFGIFLNSAAHVYSNQLVTSHRGSLNFASTFFYGYGFLTVPIGVIGLISIYRCLDYPLILRRVILVCLFYMITIIFFGLLNYFNPKLVKIPSPVYFEFFLWPIYCIGIATFSVNFVGLLQMTYKKYFLKIITNINAYLILIGFISLGLFIYPIFKTTNKRDWLFPFTTSKIINLLEKRLSHEPGDNFKGRVATFTGMKILGKLGWENLQDLDYKLLNIFGSDYRKADLWFRSIPTLTEYSSHISPRFYFFSTLFLSRKGDFQVRSMMTLRNINPEILKIMGINHIITDKKIDSLKLLAFESSKTKDSLFLYKIENANIKGVSPINTFFVNDIKQATKIMTKNNFDFNRSIILEKKLNIETKLYPVTSSYIKVKFNGTYHVLAKSLGNSILVLPIEYSSCFKIFNNIGSSSIVEIFPGNILFLSIYFKSNLNIELKYNNGPFNNCDCRLNDYLNFKKII